MAEVVLEELTKVFPGNVRAVDRLSLRVADAEFVVLVGPSGCGKTTTLRMVAGLERPTAGRISIGGRPVNDLPPRDRDVAMVFQDCALYPHMTVQANMAFGLKHRKVAKNEIGARVRRIAEMLGIAHLLGRRPAALSGGQRQRAALGRAIVRRPNAFLFDEPLSNLDAGLRAAMRAELKRLHAALGVTTIHVTHDQEEAMTLGDRIAVISDGVVQQCGPPLEVYDGPANRFVAAFVGSPPMNFFDGSLIAQDGNVFFDEGTCRIRLPRRGSSRLDRWIGRRVVLGVRPQAMSLHPQGRFAGPDNAIGVRVSVVEPLGDRMDVYAATAGKASVVARVPAEPGAGGDREGTLYVDPARLHLFEPGRLGRNLDLSIPRTASAQEEGAE